MVLGLLIAFLLNTTDTPDKAAFRALHDEAMRRAQVWLEPATPIENAQLDRNPEAADGFAADAVVECTFKPGGIGGTTPKFDCELADGNTVKVKYGRSNPEVYTEVAATRLLAALGFPTDRMYIVKRVRCYGCPADPFPQLECATNQTDGAPLENCFPGLDFTRSHDFDDAVIERPVKGRRIEMRSTRGWSWEELKYVDEVAGGATRGQIDALRLLAVFLGHWDNKAKNQRLLCLGEKKTAEGCAHPLAMVQDLGATFGPMKLDFVRWARTRIWTDAPSCRVSMKHMPYGGSTFPDAFISEDGRQFLADRLRRLSTAQIRALFEGARIARYPHRRASARSVDNWVKAFQMKVRAIVDRPACPPQPVPTVTQERPAPRR
ncbi:MAG: hypothetical protein JWL71_2159 [Acidobacteria bacterium]|nr:hypothetical protein [Acidobacteriota bacterium]